MEGTVELNLRAQLKNLIRVVNRNVLSGNVLSGDAENRYEQKNPVIIRRGAGLTNFQIQRLRSDSPRTYLLTDLSRAERFAVSYPRHPGK